MKVFALAVNLGVDFLTVTDLGKIGDTERILGRIANGKAFPREVVQLGRGLAISGSVKERLKDAAPLEKLLHGLRNCEALLKSDKIGITDEQIKTIRDTLLVKAN